jgi:hypothetical protein
MSRTDAKGLYTARFLNHRRDAKKGKDLPVYRAWRKHGEPRFHVISEHGNREECAVAERAAIDLFDALNPAKGYNLTEGGGGMHAPKGSRVHVVMTEKVWANPERNAKLSKALKGRAPAAETIAAYREWLDAGGREIRSEQSKRRWAKPGMRDHMSAKTKAQMTPEVRQHLSRIHTGRPDPRSDAGKQAQREKNRAYLATPEGKASARRGYDAWAANPDNIATNRKALDGWRASDENRRNCQRMAALAAEKCRRGVEDLETGIVYASQREMARALGLSDGAVSLRVKNGKARRVDPPVKPE